MIKKFIFILLISFIVCELTSFDFLKVDGVQIRNNYGKGNCLFLRGTNIGNLFVQESWMSSTNVRDQKTLMDIFYKKYGESKMNTLLDYYENNYFISSDFDNIQEMGMSVIRIPFTYMNLLEYNSFELKSNAFDKLDYIISEFNKRNIYVILDLHGAVGSQNGQDHSGELIDNIEDVTFYSNPEYKQKTIEIWKQIAMHFKDNPTVAAYDILNEPAEKAGFTIEKHWDYFNEIYQAIRSIDSEHIIIIESCWVPINLPNPNKYNWSNIIYEYHHYPWDFEHDASGQILSAKSLISYIKLENYNVPTYIGEFNYFGEEEGWRTILNLFNEEGYHYTSWSYKSNNMGNWGIFDQKKIDKIDPDLDDLIRIKEVWSNDYIGTGNKSNDGMVYNSLKDNLPGNVVPAKDYNDKDYFAFKFLKNNKYVSADCYGMNNLIANRDGKGLWEHFRKIDNLNDGTVSFQSRSNNMYLSVILEEDNYVIKAKSNIINDEEKFYLEQKGNNIWAMRSKINNKYVQVDLDNNNVLHFKSDTIGTWEEFTIENV